MKLLLRYKKIVPAHLREIVTATILKKHITDEMCSNFVDFVANNYKSLYIPEQEPLIIANPDEIEPLTTRYKKLIPLKHRRIIDKMDRRAFITFLATNIYLIKRKKQSQKLTEGYCN